MENDDENKHKLFILGLLLSLCLCGCGKTSDQKSDFEYQLLDGWVENKVDNTLFLHQMHIRLAQRRLVLNI